MLMMLALCSPAPLQLAARGTAADADDARHGRHYIFAACSKGQGG